MWRSADTSGETTASCDVPPRPPLPACAGAGACGFRMDAVPHDKLRAASATDFSRDPESTDTICLLHCPNRMSYALKVAPSLKGRSETDNRLCPEKTELMEPG